MPEVRLPNTVPTGLLEKIAKWHGRYSSGDVVIRIVEIDLNLHVGVFGDPQNGGYEWFIFREDEANPSASKFAASDLGYGAPEWAMRDGLMEAMGLDNPEALKGRLERWNG